MKHLESAGTRGDERGAGLCDAMREGELKVGNHELLDVWSANIFRLLDLDNTQDLSHNHQYEINKK
jgi:hypothetical protein